jgi:hypothetical protein
MHQLMWGARSVSAWPFLPSLHQLSWGAVSFCLRSFYSQSEQIAMDLGSGVTACVACCFFCAPSFEAPRSHKTACAPFLSVHAAIIAGSGVTACVACCSFCAPSFKATRSHRTDLFTCTFYAAIIAGSGVTACVACCFFCAPSFEATRSHRTDLGQYPWGPRRVTVAQQKGFSTPTCLGSVVSRPCVVCGYWRPCIYTQHSYMRTCDIQGVV